MKEQFETLTFTKSCRERIDDINAILAEYTREELLDPALAVITAIPGRCDMTTSKPAPIEKELYAQS